MRTWILLSALLLLAACGRAAPTAERRVPLTYLGADEAIDLVAPQLSEDASVSVSKNSAVLVIRGPTAQVDSIAELVRRFDRAPNVELRFQIIEANGFSNPDSAIADVEAALRDTFRFRGYRLVGESLVQAQAPGRVVQQIFAADGTPFQIQARLQRVLQSDSTKAVSLDVELQGQGALLATSLTMPSGKTVVVGTARARRDGNTLILVVRPRIE
jgi:type II secretory pathway component GspD/PulD (secretin)